MTNLCLSSSNPCHATHSPGRSLSPDGLGRGRNEGRSRGRDPFPEPERDSVSDAPNRPGQFPELDLENPDSAYGRLPVCPGLRNLSQWVHIYAPCCRVREEGYHSAGRCRRALITCHLMKQAAPGLLRLLVIFMGEGVMSQVQVFPSLGGVASGRQGPAYLVLTASSVLGSRVTNDCFFPLLACPVRTVGCAQAFPDTPVCLDQLQRSGDGRHREKGAWTG